MQGDPVIDRLMQPVVSAIRRHEIKGEARADIYNRAYEAVMNSMTVLDTMREKLSEANSNADKVELRMAEFILSYNEEVNQFNDGYVAGENGGLDPFSDQPHYEPDHDSWRNGYCAGSYDRLTRELAALKEATRWAREIINRGVELMPLDQLAQWDGVRAWQETTQPEGAAPKDDPMDGDADYQEWRNTMREGREGEA